MLEIWSEVLMKTEQEVREAITTGIGRKFYQTMLDANGDICQIESVNTFLNKEEVQDLAVIIGKALGVVK